MYKNVLQSIENIAIWPVISFVIFFLFWICLIWWVFATDREFINRMKSLPMDDEETAQAHDALREPQTKTPGISDKTVKQ